MNTADELIAGYTAYTNAEEFGATASGEAPASITVTTVSSPECIQFSASAVSGSIATTKAFGC
ncbi:LxmA leader domain family RiPP [Streptomyces alfalfae]